MCESFYFDNLGNKTKMICGKCSQGDLPKETATCCDCSRDFHIGCTKLNNEEVKLHLNRQMSWRCSDCTKTREAGVVVINPPPGGKEKGDSLLVSTLFDKLNQIEKGTKSALESVNEKLNHSEAQWSSTDGAVYEVMKSVNHFNYCTEQLKNLVKDLALRMDTVEQATRRNCLEIIGLPVESDEEILQRVKQIGEIIGYKIEDIMINACYRLMRQSTQVKDIVVNFVRRIDRDAFLEKYKTVKKKITAADLGLVSSIKIIIRDHLTATRRSLLLNAMKIAKKIEGKVQVLNGDVVLVDKKGNHKIIRCPEELEEFNKKKN